MDARNKTLINPWGPAVLMLALLLALGGCRKSTQTPSAVPATPSTGQAVETTPESTEVPMQITLNEGQPAQQVVPTGSPAQGEPLSEEEVQALLGRVPPLATETGDVQEFRLASQPIPPPRPGETIEQPFPPPAQAELPSQVEVGPLEVLRFAPEGEVSIAPQVSVTFNQPMAPLGTLDALAAEDVPVQIQPDLPGTWRWVGTKTLTFDFDSTEIDRLPMATEYTVTVPAGTRSEVGGVLDEAVSWTFTTPPPGVWSVYPDYGPQPLEPLFFVSFDQRIDPESVLAVTQVLAGREPVELRLALPQEVEADERVRSLANSTPAGRWLAFKAEQPLPADTAISVTIGPDTPSAEGPLTQPESYSFGFQTYAPLRIAEHYCGWQGSDCPPGMPFIIRFNNPLDMDAFREDLLTIQPALPGATINVYGDIISIQGATQGRTTYRVTVSGELQDAFGQTLGRDERVTFKVGRAVPRLSGPNSNFVTLDPSQAKPAFSVYTINYPRLWVQVYAVTPQDWPAYQDYLQRYNWEDKNAQPPGELVLDRRLPVESAEDQMVEFPVDLSPYMDGPSGHFIIIIQPPNPSRDDFWQAVRAWVQVTDLGVDAYTDAEQMLAWVTDLQSGAPLTGVTIQPAGPTAAGWPAQRTAEDGTARFPLPSGATYLIASKDADQAILPRSTYYAYDDGWQVRPSTDELRWYLFDDRGMYRPGETVHLKGWLRKIEGGSQGDVALPGEGTSVVSYTVYDAQGVQIGSGETPVNSLGGFDFAIELPEALNLGPARLDLFTGGSPGGSFYHSFQVQEFRRPEFEVTARNETPPPYFAGGSATVAVQAKYYAGDPLANAEVTWQVTYSPGSYSPPGWPDFTFGEWLPWWWAYDYEVMRGFPIEEGGESLIFNGLTDAAGEHYLELAFQGGESKPVSVRAEANVMDVNRQAWTDGTNLLVHPANLYVGLRSEQYFVDKGTPLKIELIVTDLDGNAVGDRPIEVRAARMTWKYQGGKWQEVEADAQDCTVGSQDEPVSCTFDTPQGGEYRITARVTDDQGRTNESSFTRWVSGGQLPPNRQVTQEELTLIPDKESYQPGDTARILVQSPFSPAEGLLTVSRSGVLYTQTFRIEDGSTTLEVPIESAQIPNINLQVDLVGQTARLDEQGEPIAGAPPRPAFAGGTLSLRIPPLERTLTVEVSPQPAELEPGGETTIELLVTDADGKPAADAELALVVVDEAILALTGYSLPDPLGIFYTDRPSGLESFYGRSSILLASPELLADGRGGGPAGVVSEEAMFAAPAEMPAAMATQTLGEAARGMSQPEAIQVRADFNPLAAFEPVVTTDAQGKASVTIKLPDNLTRYRIMAVAVDTGGKRFGQGEASLTARLPLMVRPSAPRFLNFGDQFELPVVLQNQTDETMQVSVAVSFANLKLLGVDGLLVEVPAHDRVEVRFPAAADSAGTASIQVVASAGEYADAITIQLPVYTPATTEAFATYGVIDSGAIAQPLLPPEDVFPQFGGLEIQTSSTSLQALTDAVLYLVSYPFDCSEQIASRLLAIAGLRDVLSAFQAEGLPSPEELEASIDQDITRLGALQNTDGGFPYWRKGDESIPFNSIHVAHALARALDKGYAVPPEMLNGTLAYLREIESHYPVWYSLETRRTLSAYALYARDLLGDPDPGKAQRLINEAGLEKLSLDAIGWLWPVLLDTPGTQNTLEEMRRIVNNRVVETASAANFTNSYDDQNYLLLGSDRRTDAILLDALIQDDPDADLIPKLVNGLLAHSVNGRWGSTQENVFVLVALDRYFNTYESVEPDFVARMWLGEGYVGEHAYQGYSTDYTQTVVPMSYLVDRQPENITLEKQGDGRLYYRLGLRYAPESLQLDPLEMGFVVQRRYEAVDNPADVTQDENGVWHIKAGARVRVRLTMVADTRRYHVALADPLPAGLEILNPSLAVTGSVPQDPSSPDYRYGWWWWGTWYNHQNLRDERAEAFTPLLWEGVYTYTYVTRATTPGTFIVPPAKAEEMYSPEVFGRTGTDVVVVK